MMNRRIVSKIVVSLLAACALCCHAEPEPSRLPQNHDYQKVLYRYMASLKERDFAHGVTGGVSLATGEFDPEYLYRNHIYAMMTQPLLGSKRGEASVNAAPVCFTLPYIEVKETMTYVYNHPDKGPMTISVPPGVHYTHAWPEVLMSFVRWDYPGNPYFNNRALKLRAFMAAASGMMMYHDFAEKNDSIVPPPIRPDWHGYMPVWYAFPYPDFKDVLPEDVRQAYETGLRMIGLRVMSWGIRGETCENDYIAPVGLLSIARAIDDPEFSKAVEAHTKPLYTDPRYFHPAGYWDEHGGIETGFAGAANWFASWTALMTDWPYAKDAVARVYRLRRHLILPEPDGTATGPSHFNARLGSPSNKDQWAWDGVRDATAALVTDEAAQSVQSIAPEQLREAPAARAARFNFGLGENYRIDGHYLTNEELLAYKIPPQNPWKPKLWMSFNFPASVNPGYEHYPKGAWAHRQELEKTKSPLLTSPFLQQAGFVKAFEKDFLVARQGGFAAIVHTGPVGAQGPDDKTFKFAGPLGLGGGQLSAFWTPQAGPVILGLRMGMSYDKSFDQLDAWRTWPIHAVSGVTADGRIFTSARNARPEAAINARADGATASVGGPLVAMNLVTNVDPAWARNAALYDAPLTGSNGYARTFAVAARGVSVSTTVSGDGKENLSELYETIPVYLGYASGQATNANVKIEFQTGAAWAPATEQYTEKVKAIRITRFGSPVLITFEKPQRMKLSPAPWTDNWLNVGATSRNVMIDLLQNGDKPASVKGEKTIAYELHAAR